MRGRVAAGRVLRVGATIGILVGLPVGLSACGGTGAPSATDPVETYLRALASSDGEEACAQFSGAYKREFLASYMEGFPEMGATTCGEVVEKVSAMLGSDEVTVLRGAEAKADVDGDRGTVTIAGGTSTAAVQRVDGRWLIVGGLNYQAP